MKLKQLVAILAVGGAGYFGYWYFINNFSPEAVAYKRYAEALIDGDMARVRPLIASPRAEIPFQARESRQDYIDGQVRFSWYRVEDKKVSEDGRRATLVAIQYLRVDPKGADSYWGTQTRRDRHVVTLIRDQSAWRIEAFQDTPTLSLATTVASR